MNELGVIVRRTPYGFHLDFYLNGVVVDDAGPFDDLYDAEMAARRHTSIIVHGVEFGGG